MACSSACLKEFNRKELESLLSSVLDNLDDGKVKKLSDEQFKALFHFYVDFHTKCENPHIAIMQFSRLGRHFP